MLSKNFEISSELMLNPVAMNLLAIKIFTQIKQFHKEIFIHIFLLLFYKYQRMFQHIIQPEDLQAFYYNFVCRFKRLEVKNVEYP